MVLISLRDYAEQKNISYEAVRKQVARYKADLESHIIMDGRQQFLDEEAVAFLDAKRQKNPVAIIQQSKDETIEALRQERENLLIKIAAQADKIAQQAEELREADKALDKVNMLLLSAKADKERADALEAQNADLSVEKDEAIQKALKAEKDAQKAQNELTAAQEQAAAELAEKEKEIEALKNRKWYQMIFKKGN